MGLVGNGGGLTGGGGLLNSGRHTASAYRSQSVAGSFGTESRVWVKLFDISGCSLFNASAHEMDTFQRRGIRIDKKLYTSDARLNTLALGDRVEVDGVKYQVINPTDMGDRGRAFQCYLSRVEAA